MADKIASFLAALIISCLAFGLIGLLLPLILFVIGFGLAVLALYLLGCLLG